ncbi:hypothetical protein C9994_14925 [Marivirga lumbricoides]|uniref:Uncharacterized protein n=1 Tax=Marivirga lumbricoides TaxID=1046115 RepID=A0A2T4DD70_9BACT|nr:hypothetical protein C9994_14925 [Marivirga lumbricoides]
MKELCFKIISLVILIVLLWGGTYFLYVWETRDVKNEYDFMYDSHFSGIVLKNERLINDRGANKITILQDNDTIIYYNYYFYTQVTDKLVEPKDSLIKYSDSLFFLLIKEKAKYKITNRSLIVLDSSMAE